MKEAKISTFSNDTAGASEEQVQAGNMVSTALRAESDSKHGAQALTA